MSVRRVQVKIDASLKNTCPRLALVCVQGLVSVTQSDAALVEKLNRRAAEVSREVPADKIAAHPAIAATREAYRALGKDPSRYRGSAEALVRRVTSGKGLYFINNVVDVNNLLSLESLLPVGSYDLAKVGDCIIFRCGVAGEAYKGIGKDLINLDKLPVFSDEQGPFGSPTSDSERAMITPSVTQIAMMVIDFSGLVDLDRWSHRAIDLLREHASGSDLESMLAT
jgi:DNA/RNA-binding domain of Phe-tRNA-synthetase-like protein